MAETRFHRIPITGWLLVESIEGAGEEGFIAEQAKHFLDALYAVAHVSPMIHGGGFRYGDPTPEAHVCTPETHEETEA